MAAEGLPAGDPLTAPSGWELEAWYQDLQEVLAAAESSGPPPPWGPEQVRGRQRPVQGERGRRGHRHPALVPALSLQAELCGTEGAGGGPEGCGLDAALAAELLELLGPESRAGPEPAPPGAASGRSSPPQEEAATARRGVKRKRCGSTGASGERAKRREHADEQRVLELTAHNEQLRAEIQRLSTEVQHTRAALIDRIVNLRRA
ncbi:DNA damage-inducible transcript 3 protein isoform X1 [Strigops habroptila]|uniref:DNA damage-inducible transcript 3 protein isoform X1 n=1 Tax=Strigops habroptila TaxID=2489341 RepID=UPI0011CFDF09|nr:DNA damage-inducible transcript 3 protein isoform X1 [Strigops habroptila]XP_030366518.1 DNA damage-inducible transcript 3 protein isoform X1 [Strigops habroptila]